MGSSFTSYRAHNAMQLHGKSGQAGQNIPMLSTPRGSRSPRPRRSSIEQQGRLPSPFSSHLSPECILVIAQAFPQLPALRPEVPTLLAQNSEFYLRHIIRLAKAHMRHSNSSSLCVRHVELALASATSDLRHPLILGYSSAESPPTFDSVEACPGLFVRSEPSVPLSQILYQPLSRKLVKPHIISTSLVVPHNATLGDNFPMSTRTAPHSTVSQLISILSSDSDQPSRHDRALISLSLCPSVPIKPLLSAMQDAVRTHACPDGRTNVFFFVLRIISAIASNPFRLIDAFEDSIVSIILTCLLAPSLGCGDVCALRCVAADVLFSFLTFVKDHRRVHQRVCKTLCTILTDSRSTLGTIHGALLGLSSTDPSVFQSHFLPHVGHLIDNLEQSLNSISQLSASHDLSFSLHCTITHLSLAIQRAMLTTCPLVPDDVMVDTIL